MEHKNRKSKGLKCIDFGREADIAKNVVPSSATNATNQVIVYTSPPGGSLDKNGPYGNSVQLGSGQFMSGGTNGIPQATTLAAGTGILLTPSPGALTIASTGSTVTQVLPYNSGTISWNASLGATGTVTLTQASTLNNPTNVTTGMILTLQATQDSTGSRTLTFGSNYSFTQYNNTPNPVPGAIDVWQFYANSSTSLICIDYTSSIPNWSQFDSTRSLLGQVAGTTQGGSSGATQIRTVAITPTTFLWINLSQVNGNIYSGVAIVDPSTGKITPTISPTAFGSVTVTGTCQSGLILLGDSVTAIYAYGATISGTYCCNVLPITVNGTNITFGTPVQVQSGEIVTGSSIALCTLSATDFGISFRTTAAGNPLYMFQGHNNTGTLTFSPALPVETGGSSGGNVQMSTQNSTTAMLLYGSTLVSPSTLLTRVITFNGIGNAPTMGNTFLIASTFIIGTEAGLMINVQSLPTNGYFLVSYMAQVTFPNTQINLVSKIIQNNGGAISLISNFVTVPVIGTVTNGDIITATIPDQNHAVITFTGTSPPWLFVLNIDPTFTLSHNFTSSLTTNAINLGSGALTTTSIKIGSFVIITSAAQASNYVGSVVFRP